MEIKIDKIRHEVKRLGWTIQKLSNESGVSRQTIYHIWEHPEAFRNDTIEKIAKALNFDVKDLIS